MKATRRFLRSKRHLCRLRWAQFLRYPRIWFDEWPKMEYRWSMHGALYPVPKAEVYPAMELPIDPKLGAGEGPVLCLTTELSIEDCRRLFRSNLSQKQLAMLADPRPMKLYGGKR